MFAMIGIKNNTISKIMTGLSLGIYSLFLIQVPLTIDLSQTTSIIILKIIVTLFIGINMFSYLIIKYKYNYIFELYYALKSYQKQIFLNNINQKILLVITLSMIVISMIFSCIFFNYNPSLDNIFNDLYISIPGLRKNSTLALLLVNTYMFSIQHIYYDLNMKYLEIVKNFYIELKRKTTEPVKNVIINTQRSILMLNEFQYKLRNNVNFIKYFIILNMTAANIVMFYLFISIYEFNFKYIFLMILYTILLNTYVLFTKLLLNKKCQITKDLVNKINNWRLITKKDDTFIELDILKITINSFCDVHNIQPESQV